MSDPAVPVAASSPEGERVELPPCPVCGEAAKENGGSVVCSSDGCVETYGGWSEEAGANWYSMTQVVLIATLRTQVADLSCDLAATREALDEEREKVADLKRQLGVMYEELQGEMAVREEAEADLAAEREARVKAEADLSAALSDLWVINAKRQEAMEARAKAEAEASRLAQYADHTRRCYENMEINGNEVCKCGLDDLL